MTPGNLRIVYRGNFQPNVPPERHWSTETQVARTLEAIGHEVVRMQEPPYEGCATNTWDEIAAAAVDGEADLFLWTQTYNVDPEGAWRTLDLLRCYGIPSASFHLDLWFGLARAVQLLDFPFFRTDYVFTADGGHQDDFRRNGINHHWTPPAIYGPEATVGTPDPTLTAWPVIFLGSHPYPHPEHADARRDLILWLQSRFGRQFRHYRSGYRGQALADLIASTRIVVGDSCLAGRTPRYWSDRIPEVLGRGGFLLHPYVEGIEEHYTDGKHLRTFEAGDLGQVANLVQHYLHNPAEADQIGAEGRRHVLAAHTYRHRLESVLATVGLAGAPSSKEAATV